MSALRQTIQCSCGKVKVAIDSPSALRLVCYCKDCRGYYQTLNKTAKNDKKPAEIDPWGGVDWTQVYPNELSVVEGKEHLTTCIIRPKSPIHRVYANCCYTPMFTLGQSMGSAMVNTHLIPEKDQPHVRFRIIGRDSIKGAPNKPSMSWSVPISWFWTMPRRIHKEQATPAPVSDPVSVLEGFQQG